MGKEDIKLKSYLEDSRRYADLWNGAVFGGKEVLKAGNFTEANPVLYQPDGQTVLERNRDLVMKQTSDGKCYAVFTVENQNTIDYSMPARIMLQEALEYNRQIRAIARKNESAAQRCDSTDARGTNAGSGCTVNIYQDAGERLYRFKKTDRLYPVATLVVYWGEEEWSGARTLHDMIDFGIGDSSMEAELRKLVPKYPIRFLNVSTFRHSEYFKSELRPLLELFKRRNDKKAFIEYIESNEAGWSMNDESWHILSQLTHSKSLERLIREKNQQKQAGILRNESEAMIMCKAIDDLENDARNEGIAIGRAEGKAEGRAEGKAESILELLEDYEQIPDDLIAKILAQKDPETLKQWHKLAARVSNIQDFIHAI